MSRSTRRASAGSSAAATVPDPAGDRLTAGPPGDRLTADPPGDRPTDAEAAGDRPTDADAAGVRLEDAVGTASVPASEPTKESR